jgi:hypothetical protein
LIYITSCKTDEEELKLLQKRDVFNTYPIYLKHTLLHDDADMKKVRTLEIAQRFFVFDKFRERGNKEYNKGDFDVKFFLKKIKRWIYFFKKRLLSLTTNVHLAASAG